MRVLKFKLSDSKVGKKSPVHGLCVFFDCQSEDPFHVLDNVYGDMYLEKQKEFKKQFWFIDFSAFMFCIFIFINFEYNTSVQIIGIYKCLYFL